MGLIGRCGAALAEEGYISSETSEILREIEALLRLEYVDREGSIEMTCFLAIDASDPVVEEICLLTDGLTDAIETWKGRRALKDGRDEAA